MKTGASIFALAVLSACAGTGTGSGGTGDDEKPDVEPVPLENIDKTINDAVMSSADTTNEIAQVDVAIAEKGKQEANANNSPPSVVLPTDSVQPVTVTWDGPIEEFLEQMAGRAGYFFRATGKAPTNPAVISIAANEEPLFGVVRRAGALAHDYADIGFNPSSRVIEIRYRN